MAHHILTTPEAVPLILLVGLALGLASAAAAGTAAEGDVAETILSLERAALDRWGNGDPDGFLEISAEEVTYFDPFLEKRLDGLAALKQLYDPIRGKIDVDRFELIDPKVQVHGDTALLTFNLTNWGKAPDGTPKMGARWNSTEVYSRIDGKWKIIHSHWSLTKHGESQSASEP